MINLTANIFKICFEIQVPEKLEYLNTFVLNIVIHTIVHVGQLLNLYCVDFALNCRAFHDFTSKLRLLTFLYFLWRNFQGDWFGLIRFSLYCYHSHVFPTLFWLSSLSKRSRKRVPFLFGFLAFRYLPLFQGAILTSLAFRFPTTVVTSNSMRHFALSPCLHSNSVCLGVMVTSFSSPPTCISAESSPP